MSTNEGFTAMDLDGEEVQRRDSYLRSVPRSVVMGIPVDCGGRFLVHKRSDSVRSAPGVWSFPTGMHEHGKRLDDELARELEEEHGLKMDRVVQAGWYESISPGGDGWHWVIHVYVCRVVGDLRDAKNLEPDKHSAVETYPTFRLSDADWLRARSFHQSFVDWATWRRLELRLLAEEVAKP